MMNGTDLNDLRGFLLLQKSRILNKSVEFRAEQMKDHEDTCDEADKVSIDQSLSLSIHLHERDRSSLLMIEKALGKIAEGTYGLCEACTDFIHVKRLQARPFTALCISCMEEQEENLHS
jgi:DnaK suppressor protein